MREQLGARDFGAGSEEAVGGGSGADVVLDALGSRCPIPVIELAKVIAGCRSGGTVTVLSDDEAARLDIPAWCEMRGQEYVGEREAAHGRAYVVRRLA